jgi:hypothetical protein
MEFYITDNKQTMLNIFNLDKVLILVVSQSIILYFWVMICSTSQI